MKVEFTDKQITFMQKALSQWGLAAQVGQTVEECAELIVALQKYINRTPSAQTIDNIADEIADVEMMLAQLRIAFDLDDEAFRKRIEGKFAKLEQYLEDDTV